MDKEEILVNYKELWENPEQFVLLPTFSHGYDYMPYKNTGIRYNFYPILEDVRPIVIRKMLDADVKIVQQVPSLKETDLRGARSHEFVLVENNHLMQNQKYKTIYVVYHKSSKDYLAKTQLDPTLYNEICLKMIDAGVEIWSRDKWNKYKSDNLLS